jgi:hypothetical protein
MLHHPQVQAGTHCDLTIVENLKNKNINVTIENEIRSNLLKDCRIINAIAFKFQKQV